MNWKESYEFWRTDSFFDDMTHEELDLLKKEHNQKEEEDRFYRNLEFGTGGLRGIMGAGTNRMNQYTVGRATAGLGAYLLDVFGRQECSRRGAVIAYDTRNNSQAFAAKAADVLSAMGIRVFLFSEARPTPQLSFSVKYKNSLAGIVVTASHNPKEYNGYKVYDEYGCQLVVHQAKQVMKWIDTITDYRKIDFSGNPDLIEKIDTTEEFVAAVRKQSRYQDTQGKGRLSIVYTPLHGTGCVPVQKALALDGFTGVTVTASQEKPDGNFPTVVSPNPEDRHALEEGILQASRKDADIVIGTDPDCDRIGVAVKDAGKYTLLTGNQTGALLVDFVLSNTDLKACSNPAVIKTVVTSELGASIARKRGLKVFSTLTGFKYIGEKITQFEQAQADNNQDKDFEFLIGYEESYGYLVGTHARDKDAVVAALLICEMAAKYKKEGKTLLERMQELYWEFGFYLDALDSYTLKGKDGQEKIAGMMKILRSQKPQLDEVNQVIDYSSPVKAEEGFGCLPVSDVLKYVLKDGSWLAVRPSGTEPKIKIYYSIKGENKQEAADKLVKIKGTMETTLGLIK